MPEPLPSVTPEVDPPINPFSLASVINSVPPPSAYARLAPGRRRTVDRWLSGLPAAEAAADEDGDPAAIIEGSRDAINERREARMERAGLHEELVLRELAQMVVAEIESGPFARVKAGDKIRALALAAELLGMTNAKPTMQALGPGLTVIVNGAARVAVATDAQGRGIVAVVPEPPLATSPSEPLCSPTDDTLDGICERI